MSGTRILVAESERFSARARATLTAAAEVTFADLDRRELLQNVPDFDVLWVRLRNRIDAEVIQAGSRIKWIATPTTGLTHIDVAAADRRGVGVLSLRGETDFLRNIRATAEHTLGLMLALIRNLPTAADHVRQGGWDRDRFLGGELHEKTIGIVGYGRLGSLVASYLQTFGARVIAADPYRERSQLPELVELVPLEVLLSESDGISVHVNLTAETTGLIGESEFDRMKQGAWLVNTSRGEVIDEAALLRALTNERLRGAALDVLANETSSGMAASELVAYARQNPNLLITPHIGGCTAESMAKTEDFLAQKLCAVLRESSVTA